MCMFCEFEDTNAKKIVVYGNETIYSERKNNPWAHFVLARSEVWDNQTQLICGLGLPIRNYEAMTIFYCPMCGREL